jgi:outer membrane protein
VLKIRRALWLAVALPVFVSMSVPASAETIKGAMAKAYANNPDINAARAGLRATDESVTIAKAGYRPQVSAVASYNRTFLSGVNNLSGANGVSTTESIGLNITQQIFDGFQTLNRVNAANASVYATREQLRGTEMQILFSAAQAYANVALYQEIVASRRQNLGFLNEQLKAANARLQVGEGTRTDVSQSEAQSAAARALLAAAQAQLKQSQAVYYQIVGDKPTGIRQAGAATGGIARSIDSAVALGLQQHPSILAAEHAVEAAGYQVKTAEGAMLPGVVLQGSVARNYGEPSTLSSPKIYNSAGFGAQVTIPLYKGGAEYGGIRQAKETLDQQTIRVDSARLAVQQAIVSAYAQLEASRASIAANKAQLSAANMALSGVMEERKVGQATTLDVLTSQQTVLNAREGLAQAQHDLVVASYSVLTATGQLTVESQNLQVAKYNPEEHYNAVKDAWFGLRTVGGN